MIKRIFIPLFILTINSFLFSQSDCTIAVDYGAVGSASKTATLDLDGSYWFSFTTDGTVDKIEISTCGSSFDTNLDIYASCAATGPLLSNDNACGKQSVINYSNLAAGTYYVKLSGKNNESGSFTLKVDTPKVPEPPGSIFASAYDDSINVSWSKVANATSYKVYQVVDDASGMTCEDQGLKTDCDGNCFSKDVALSWLGDGTCDDGTYGVNFNCALYNFDDGDCTPGEVSNINGTDKPMASILSKTAVLKSYILRGRSQDTTRVFSGFYPDKNLDFVSTAINSAGESAFSNVVNVTTPPPYAGQTCEIATEISSGTFEGLGKNQYFSFTSSFDADINISSNNADSSAIWDTNLIIYSDCSLDSIIVANDDCCGLPGPSTVSLRADSGSTYILFWENSNNPGPFTFNVTETALVKSYTPSNLSISSNKNTIELNWDDQAAADYYTVYLINDLDSAIYNNISYQNSAEIFDLEYETKYSFAVSATGYNGETQLSDIVSIYTEESPPPPYFNPLLPLSGPIDPMYFYVDSAMYDGKMIGDDWEVGIFDDSVLVSALVINDEMLDGFTLVATADDTTTAIHDGFRSDSSITFKFYSRLFLQSGEALPTFSTNNVTSFKRNSTTNLKLSMDKFGARDCAFKIPTDWSLDKSQYLYNMNLTAHLNDGQVALDDTLYTLAAFINGEIRGLSRVEYLSELDKYQVRISIYSNNTSGEIVRFQLFNGVACQIQPVIEETIPFVAGGFAGSAGLPIELHATDDRLMTIQVDSGLNLFSLNVELSSMNPNTVLGRSGFTNKDQIKTLSGFSAFSDSLGWIGTLGTMSVSTMYSLSLQTPQRLIIAGKPANYKTTEVNYSKGWNWIGYLPDITMSVDEALSDLRLTPSSRILHQNGYAEYVDQVGWVGSLSELNPGEGFLLETDTSGFFIYGKKPSLGKALNTLDDSLAILQDSIALEAFGEFNPQNFQYNMTLIGEIQFDGSLSDDINDMVAVYVGSELRGISRTIYIEQLNKYLSFLQIYSNQIEGEELIFRTFDHSIDNLNFVDGTLPFLSDSKLGILENPILISLSLIDPGSLPDQYQLDQNYPNPFNMVTNIDYAITQVSQVKISIFNMKGQKVKSLVNGKEAPGLKTLEWKGLNDQGKPMPSGVYIIVMEAQPITAEVNFDWFRKSRKMLFLK